MYPLVTPEAPRPRTIADVLGTLDRLPFHLRARSEFEYVGAKPLGDGFTGVPVKEFCLALLRSFSAGRMSVGMNLFIARGYTGQTTETFALPDETAPFERIVGMRLPLLCQLFVYIPFLVTASSLRWWASADDRG